MAEPRQIPILTEEERHALYRAIGEPRLHFISRAEDVDGHYSEVILALGDSVSYTIENDSILRFTWERLGRVIVTRGPVPKDEEVSDG